jgi:hypothetical protein
MTIHFDKTPPDSLEQWLGTEARYIIGTFGKPSDLLKIYGAKTDAVISECKQRGDNVVLGITMVLDSDLRKLDHTLVRLQNGDSFLIDGKYRLDKDAGTKELVDALLLEESPRVFSVRSK